MEKPIQQEKYGKMLWITIAMDTLRKEHCMCLHCANLHPGESNNCGIAQSLFDNYSKIHGNAFIMTRCDQWKAIE